MSVGDEVRKDGLRLQQVRFTLETKTPRMNYTIRLLMGAVAIPSLQVFKNKLEKHLSGMISGELLLPWAMEMD